MGLDATQAAIIEKAGKGNPAAFNPGGQIVIDYISRWVEVACCGMGLDLQGGVVAGLLPSITINGSSSDFFGSGMAIVGIDAGVLTFTAALGNLLARSIQWTSGVYPGFELNGETAFQRVLEDATLLEDWHMFFVRYAGIPFVLSFTEAALDPVIDQHKVELMSGFEVFVVGHEYGHHIHQHNVGLASASDRNSCLAHEREFQADLTAIDISTYLGTMGFRGDKLSTQPNLWMESGAAAVAYLCAADCARRVKEILRTGNHTDEVSPSHPQIDGRLRALERRLHPRRNLDFRVFVVYLIRSLFNHHKIKFFAAHRAARSDEGSALRYMIDSIVD